MCTKIDRNFKVTHLATKEFGDALRPLSNRNAREDITWTLTLNAMDSER
jgi:hypothetical protein